MSSDTTTALDTLEQRAGASDHDRAAWLAERRGGITATQVRDVLLEQLGLPSWSKKQELIDEKLGRRVDDFAGSPYTDWGNVREPVIAGVLAAEGFSPESRVFRHPENARYLASPDGIRINFDEEIEVLEIKTSSHDLPPGSEAIRKRGYELQVQWVMFVLGARRCRFVVEERLGAPGRFAPGEVHRYWIERDETLIARLIKVADDFLREMDHQRDHGAPAIDEELDTHAVNVLTFRDSESSAKRAKEKAWQSLLGELVAGGKDFSQESTLARITFTAGVASLSEVPDVEAAKKADPELFAEVEALSKRWNAHQALHTKTVTSAGKPSLTVTAMKSKGNAA